MPDPEQTSEEIIEEIRNYFWAITASARQDAEAIDPKASTAKDISTRLEIIAGLCKVIEEELRDLQSLQE